MALRLRASRSFKPNIKVGAFLLALGLALQPLMGLPMPTASAASMSVSPISHRIDGVAGGSARAESVSNAQGYENLSLAFNYDINKLEPGKVFTYGWRTSTGADQSLGSIEGQTNTGNNPGADEVGSRTVPLPASAAVSGLTLVFKHTGELTGSNDRIEITNIALSGSLVPALEQDAVCDTGCEWTTVAAAVAGEAAGSTITIKANSPQTITSTVLVNKQLTITGEPGAKILTSGGSHIFVTTGAGVTISNLAFEKTDKTRQNMINVQGANTTISGNTFTGQYVMGDGQVDRAIEVSTTTGLAISGNEFTSLRQPAYINDNTTGSITNNFVDGTRGWVVVANSNLDFSGNTWGENALDIAIIPGAPNNYTCRLAQIVADNNNANVEDQAPATYCPITPGAVVDYTVNGSTTATENDAKKWFFNRDASTSTPYEFNTDQAATGTGSLYVKPIGANAKDKFIGEYFVASKLDDTGSISFDYRLGDSVAASKANQIYANVYVNFSSTEGYGDCVYNVVATNGAAGWHTLTFNPNENYSVRSRTATPCPAKPSDLATTAYLRAISLNVGDTNINDLGVDAYLDNVRVETVAETSVYNFDPIAPDTTKPTVVLQQPTVDGLNPTTIVADATDDRGLDKVTANVRNAAGTIVQSCSKSAAGATNYQLSCLLTTTLPDGVYSVRYNAIDTSGNLSSTQNRSFEVDRSAPDVAIVKPSQGASVRGTVAFEGTVSDANPQASYLRITGPDGYVVTDYYNDGRESHLFSWNTVGLTDGTYKLRFEARDAAGNKDAGSVKDISVSVDNTKGTTTVVSAQSGNFYTTNFTILAESSDTGGLSRTIINLYDDTDTLIDSCTNEAANGATTHQFSCDVNVDDLDNGAYYAKVNASDKAGNVTNTVKWSFNVDHTKPVTTTDDQPTAPYRDNFTVNASATDDESGIVRAVMNLYKGTVLIGSCTNETISPASVAHDFKCDVDVNELGNGSYTLRINSRDAAGNTSNTVSWNFVVDTSEPIGISIPDGEETPVSGDDDTTDTGNQGSTGGSSNNTGGTASGNSFAPTQQIAALPSFIGAVNNGAATESQASDNATTDGASAEAGILGTSTTESESDGDVAGASDEAGWSIADMAWYWWVVAVLGAIGVWLLLAAGIRRIRGTNV